MKKHCGCSDYNKCEHELKEVGAKPKNYPNKDGKQTPQPELKSGMSFNDLKQLEKTILTKNEKEKTKIDSNADKFEDPWDQAKHEREVEDLKTPKKKDKEINKSDTDLDLDDQADYSPKEKIEDSARFFKNEKITANSLYRHYKHSPHHPLSLGLKYIVHRIENHDQYKLLDSKHQDRLDNDFLSHHQQGKASQKNGWVTKDHLRNFIKNNPHLIGELKDHQKKLHDLIKETSQNIKKINGEDHVALTRGLNRGKILKDHALASYADEAHTGFGNIMHHRWVPLKNVWYSYDAGPKNASSKRFGNEDEFIVSPHKIRRASEKDVHNIIPRGYHDYGKNDKNKQALNFHLAAYRHTPPETLDKLADNENLAVLQAVARNLKTSTKTLKKLSNHKNYYVTASVAENPNTPPEILDKLADHESVYTAHNVANNSSTSQKTLDKLANHKDFIVASSVAHNVKASPKTLERLANHPREYVIATAAQNPKMPIKTLHKLLNHSNRMISNAAKLGLSQKTKPA